MSETRSRSVRLPDALWDLLEQEAEQDDRTVSYVIRKILEEHFKPHK